MTPTSDERTKALDLAIAQIEKQFGKGSIVRLGAEEVKIAADAIPTGALGLDLALGVGGIPRGRVVEVFGPEASGKTTLTLSIIAQCQKRGGTAVFIDAEHALQPSYAELIGVQLENLHVSQPGTGEEALEIADQLVRSGAVDLVVIDSVAALVPRAEIEGEMGDAHVGLQARLMSQALRKLTGSISKSRTTVIFINQIRMKIGVMFGNPETTSGGNALKFYSSLRLDIRKVATIKERDAVVGNRCRVRVVKNKVAPPFRSAEFDIMFDEGISRTGELLDLGLDAGVLSRSGTWLSYGDERLGQGRENSRRTLRENPAMAVRLENEVRQHLGLLPLAAAESADAGSASDPDASGAEPETPSAERKTAADASKKSASRGTEKDLAPAGASRSTGKGRGGKRR
ncbi:MAG: recombinase RecA [Candidatus Eisenbacteria bacterium]|nr:recombinase RecA [Candidatus Eisenbacteria bacterium]